MIDPHCHLADKGLEERVLDNAALFGAVLAGNNWCLRWMNSAQERGTFGDIPYYIHTAPNLRHGNLHP